MRLLSTRFAVLISAFCMLVSCSENDRDTLFEQLDAETTGIHFVNKLHEEEGFDVFRYRNYYNGGGVGVGDLNNDGLADIYFTANQESNRLYFNRGDMRFEDVTEQSGTGGRRPWSTGVNFVDINADGWLDIYVSNSGDPRGENRANELFINNRDGTFSEKAAAYGLNDKSFTTHAAFFDYDQDGDLDCYLVNNSFRPVSSLPLRNMRKRRDKYGGDKLLENRGGRFVDVSEEAGIFGNVAAFGLAVTLLDVNNDGWTDMFVSNDFFERDYLYVNRQGKGFKEQLEHYFDQISLAAMGADAADINNDALPDLFVTEMLPDTYRRMKQMTTFETKELLDYKDREGFYRQFQRNTLQLNNGDGTFSEIGRYAGVAATDWSWGTLIFDMNNSGSKEIFVTNGVYKDVTDQDFLQYFGSEENLQAAREGSEIDFNKFVDRMPSTPLTNYVFTRDSVLTYTNRAPEWGFDARTFSNGLAYGDLDNDGDQDLVINNLNQPSLVYENRSRQKTGYHYLSVKLRGGEGNRFGIGARLTAYTGEQKIMVQNYPSRGFQSSVDYTMILGLGRVDRIDSLDIEWDARRRARYHNLPVDTTLTFSITDAQKAPLPARPASPPMFRRLAFDHAHRENAFNDFKSEPLMFHQLSREGPALAAGDVNGDGRDDFYIGGAAGQSGALYLNSGDAFRQLPLPAFGDDRRKEDVDAAFFDADGDRDLDLYVVSGGNEQRGNMLYYEDRLYINRGPRGEPRFERSGNLPRLFASGSVVAPADYDGDGDMDLFVGSRSIPGEYGRPASSYLLENDGTGQFREVSSTYMSQLHEIGMVTDAAWTDYDNDGDLDLTLVGEWMPVVFFENRGNFFQRQFNMEGLEQSAGWWYSLTPTDVNGDGRMDFIAGNLGTNSMFRTSGEQPVRLFINDFDRNSTLDHIYTFNKEGKYIPYHLRSDLARQIGFVETKFPDYASYADKSIDAVFSDEQLTASIQLTAYTFASALIINKGNGRFVMYELPPHAQFAPVMAARAADFNRDGRRELLLAGNFSATKPQEGSYDANHGLLYRVDPEGRLSRVPYTATGLKLRGDVRAMEILNTGNRKYLIIGKNDGQTEIYVF